MHEVWDGDDGVLREQVREVRAKRVLHANRWTEEVLSAEHREHGEELCEHGAKAAVRDWRGQ